MRTVLANIWLRLISSLLARALTLPQQAGKVSVPAEQAERCSQVRVSAANADALRPESP